MHLVARIVTHVADLKPDAVFVDATGVGDPVQTGYVKWAYAIDVNFTSKAGDH